MKQTILVIFFLIFAITISPVQAEKISTAISAMHFYMACDESASNDYARGFCNGAIDDFYSSMDNWYTTKSGASLAFGVN